MSTEEAPPQEETPNTPTSDTPEIPWQKRYEDLRPEFDRTTQALKSEQEVWEDEQALLARIAEKHPHLIAAENDGDDDDEETFDEETPEPKPDPRVDALLAWQAEQQFEKDLSRFVGDRELSDKGREVVEALTVKGGNNPKALEAAVNQWFEISPPPEEGKPKPNAPHVLKGGKPASETPDFSQMSPDQINEYMAERAKALMS